MEHGIQHKDMLRLSLVLEPNPHSLMASHPLISKQSNMKVRVIVSIHQDGVDGISSAGMG